MSLHYLFLIGGISMEKVVIETGMKKLPESCSKCKYKIKGELDTTLCTAHSKYVELKKTYVKEKNNWCYLIPDTCPLALYDVEE